MKTRAAVLREIGRPLSVETLDLADPGPGEVLVRIAASGICHSDHHVISGLAAHALPVVLGHEGAGRIAAVGPGTQGVEVGDHVVLNWRPCCGCCFQCAHAASHLCRTHEQPLWQGTMLDGTCRLSSAGLPVRHLAMLGAWAEWAVVPRQSCIPIHADMPFDCAALLGCAVASGVGAVANRARVQPGESVVVIGVGGVGLAIVMGAALAGAGTIIAIDAAAATEELARALGATAFVHASDDVAREVMASTTHGADHVFEAVGKRGLQRLAIDLARPGGRVVFVGLDASDATIALPTTEITRTEKWITGSIFGSVQPERDLAVYALHYLAGRLPIDRLIGRRYELDQINEAVEDMLNAKPGRGVLVFDHASM